MSDQFSEDEAQGHYEIDWELLYHRIDGEEDPEIKHEVRAEASKALAAILDWVMDGVNPDSKIKEKLIARRVMALLWVTRPDFMKSKSMSLTRLSQYLGVTPPLLTVHAVSATQTFGVTNPKQKHGWNRKKAA